MKKLIFLSVLCMISTIGIGQNMDKDTVFLKNDSVIVCTILRIVPLKVVKIQIGPNWQNNYRIRLKDVKRTTKDSLLKAKEEKILAKEDKIRVRKEKASQRPTKNCYFKGIVECNDYIGESYYKKGGYYSYICSWHCSDHFDNGKGSVGYSGTNLILGCQLYKKLFMGAGIGFNINVGAEMISGAGYPAFLDLRYYFTKKNTQPFINLSSGILLNDDYLQKHTSPEANYHYHSFINPSAGIKFMLGNNHNIDLSVGSSLLFTKKILYQGYYDHATDKGTLMTDVMQNKTIGLIVKIGFSF